MVRLYRGTGEKGADRKEKDHTEANNNDDGAGEADDVIQQKEDRRGEDEEPKPGEVKDPPGQHVSSQGE